MHRGGIRRYQAFHEEHARLDRIATPVMAAVNHLPTRSCLIDGEVACDENVLAIFGHCAIN
jgi:hypothetical protein